MANRSPKPRRQHARPSKSADDVAFERVLRDIHAATKSACTRSNSHFPASPPHGENLSEKARNSRDAAHLLGITERLFPNPGQDFSPEAGMCWRAGRGQRAEVEVHQTFMQHVLKRVRQARNKTLPGPGAQQGRSELPLIAPPAARGQEARSTGPSILAGAGARARMHAQPIPHKSPELDQLYASMQATFAELPQVGQGPGQELLRHDRPALLSRDTGKARPEHVALPALAPQHAPLSQLPVQPQPQHRHRSHYPPSRPLGLTELLALPAGARLRKHLARLFTQVRALPELAFLQDDVLRDLCPHLTLALMDAGQAIPLQGEGPDGEGQRWYVLLQGRVKASCDAGLPNPRAQGEGVQAQATITLQPDVIGDASWDPHSSLLDAVVRPSSTRYVARTDCQLLQVPRKEYLTVLRLHEGRQVHERRTFFATHPLLCGVETTLQERLVKSSTLRHLKLGEVLLHFGQPRETLVFVYTGRLSVEIRAPGTGGRGVPWGTLQAGEYLGEELARCTPTLLGEPEEAPLAPSCLQVRAAEEGTCVLLLTHLPTICKLRKELPLSRLYSDVASADALHAVLETKERERQWRRLKDRILTSLLRERTGNPTLEYARFLADHPNVLVAGQVPLAGTQAGEADVPLARPPSVSA